MKHWLAVNLDGTFLGELDGIAQKILQDLLEPLLVAGDQELLLAQLGGHVDFQLQAEVVSLVLVDFHDLGDGTLDVEALSDFVELLGLDFGVVEHIVDQESQLFGTGSLDL